nr:unnamed protein product [Digitaria exilis]
MVWDSSRRTSQETKKLRLVRSSSIPSASSILLLAGGPAARGVESTIKLLAAQIDTEARFVVKLSSTVVESRNGAIESNVSAIKLERREATMARLPISTPLPPWSPASSQATTSASRSPQPPRATTTFVWIREATPDSVAAWLSAAARRLSGRLVFCNSERGIDAQEDGEEEAAHRGAFELPCLESASAASLHLGFLCLTVPPAGVFARLEAVVRRLTASVASAPSMSSSSRSKQRVSGQRSSRDGRRSSRSVSLLDRPAMEQQGTVGARPWPSRAAASAVGLLQ